MTPERERFNGWAQCLDSLQESAYATTGQIIPGVF